MEFSELIRGFASEIGISDVDQMINDGMCAFDFGETVVNFVDHSETKTLVMCAEIAPVPEEGKSTLSQMMMKEMFVNGVSKGTIFSIDATSGKFHLHRCDCLKAIDLNAFKKIVADFVSTVDKWRNQVLDFRPAIEAASSGFSKSVTHSNMDTIQV